MLKKISYINNVGTFLKHAVRGDSELRRLNLIHGENGRGKTTLCALLRSLRNGDPNLIQERKTIDSPADPSAHLIFDSGICEFKDGAWKATYPRLQIFDSEFITENVYSGDSINHDHKRNLCRIVLGEEGVKLAEKMDELDAQERTAASALNTTKADVQKLAPRGMTVEEFIALPNDSEIDAKIVAKKKEISVIADAVAIRQKAELKEAKLSELPRDINAILGMTIEGVAADAELQVREHISQHVSAANIGNPEGWLQSGLAASNGRDCPFCAQSLDGSPVIDSIRDFFSAAYRKFNRQLADFSTKITTLLSGEARLDIQSVVGGNDSLSEFWKRYATAAMPQLSFETDIAPVFDSLKSELLPLIERKLISPLSAIGISPNARAALESHQHLIIKIEHYNEAVRSANTAIQVVKTDAESKSASRLKAELEVLRVRHPQPSI
jgi:wobble nucleotide-excising tRNase